MMIQDEPIVSQDTYQSINHFIVQHLGEKIFPSWRTAPVNKPKFSLVLAIIFALLLLLGVGVNFLFGQGKVDPQILSIFLLGLLYIFILCIVLEFLVANFLKTCQGYLMAALIKEEDRQRLLRALANNFSIRRQLWFGVSFSVLAHAAFIALDPSLITKFGPGYLLTNVIFHAFHGFCVYFFIAYLSWGLSELRDYQYDLFELDPSSSEIIPKLATLLQSNVLIMTLMVASATLIFSSTHILPFVSVAAMVLLMWASTIALFLINRDILKSIIVRAKWEKLRKIQAQIFELESKDRIPTRDTLEYITQLKEFHDKIKNTPDTLWDFTKFFTMMNTLVWPTFGIIASNITAFQKLITGILTGSG